MLPANLGDDLQVCPYDATHMIQKKSFQKHLIKCRQNFKNAKKVTCRFDKTHIVPQQELQHHLRTCPSRSVMDREMQLLASDGSVLTGAVQAPEIQNHLEDLDEDWDSEPPFRPTNALFNKKEPDFEIVEQPKTKYIPPGANYVQTPVKSEEHSILEHAKKNIKQEQISLDHDIGCDEQTRVKSVEPSVLEYARKTIKKEENSLDSIGGGRGLPSVNSLPKFNYLGRGISRFDGPLTPGLLVQRGQSQPSSIPSRPVPPPGFMVPEQPMSVALEAAPPVKTVIETMEEELRFLIERQEEEKIALDRRHREERARLMLKFQNGIH